MFDDEQLAFLSKVTLSQCRAEGVKLATAESCTGGLAAALLTSVPGSSDVFERGFVTYSNESKTELLGVPAEIIAIHGAVSEETACAMAEGALARSRADIAISITGIAGPSGGTEEKPVGLVWFAAACRRKTDGGVELLYRAKRFGDLGRARVRSEAAAAALELALAALAERSQGGPAAE
jgi:nicotinamide-nucleotide amidase